MRTPEELRNAASELLPLPAVAPAQAAVALSPTQRGRVELAGSIDDCLDVLDGVSEGVGERDGDPVGECVEAPEPDTEPDERWLGDNDWVPERLGVIDIDAVRVGERDGVALADGVGLPDEL